MKDVIQEKLSQYNCQTREDEENAIKEITQELALYALKEAGFFEKASFLGGTCLRITHGLDRFSEDLDFALNEVDSNFKLSSYLSNVVETMRYYGYEVEVTGEDKSHKSISTRFLKDDSIKKLLEFKHRHDLRKKIQIKVEVDINPPPLAVSEVNYLDFPTDFMIKTHNLESLLAGKCHALLCRNYVKGRDWYDYLWYISKGVKINMPMFQEAIKQAGPWKGQREQIDSNWLKRELDKKVQSLDWKEVKRDVVRFLSPEKIETLNLWSNDFFLKKNEKFIRFFD